MENPPQTARHNRKEEAWLPGMTVCPQRWNPCAPAPASSHLCAAGLDVFASLAELAWKSSLSDAVGSPAPPLLRAAKPNRQPSCVTQWSPAVPSALPPLFHSRSLFWAFPSRQPPPRTDTPALYAFFSFFFFCAAGLKRPEKDSRDKLEAAQQFFFCPCILCHTGMSSGMFANWSRGPHLSTQK